MLILGLDVATTTGFALYRTGAPLAEIRASVIRAKGCDAEEKAASLGLHLISLINQTSPDFVAIEQPMRNIVSYRKKGRDLAGDTSEQTVNPAALHLSSLTGAAVAIIAGFNLPWETIPSSTWRKHFLGIGRSANHDRAAWKRAAVDRCKALGVKVRNSDAAEAVGVAMAAEACQRFRLLRQTRATA